MDGNVLCLFCYTNLQPEHFFCVPCGTIRLHPDHSLSVVNLHYGALSHTLILYLSFVFLKIVIPKISLNNPFLSGDRGLFKQTWDIEEVLIFMFQMWLLKYILGTSFAKQSF